MVPIPISKTKIIAPRRREELLSRKRLLDMLFEALDKKLLLISAPAGYGKTSLLIDLAHQGELPCCWLALDELDRDPQRFIAYFISAIAEQFQNFGTMSMGTLSRLTSLEQDMERLIVTLVNEAYEQIHEHFILVLDDFHIVDDIPPIQNFLNRFVQMVDENCHLIISSRALTGLPDLPLLIAREHVSGLNFSDLAFHVDEIQALLEQNYNVQIPDAEAQKLVDETEGWITGLQFSNIKPSRGTTAKAATVAGVGLFDYLGQQVLDRQPAALREFLLRTSLMDEFDASLCRAALAQFYPEEQDWQGWINTVVRNNLFALPVGDDGQWIRYHHLFRDFLRTRMENERSQEVRPILIELGRAYEGLGEWEKAHYVYKKLNDMNALAAMIERSGTPMLRHAIVTLESWVYDLPPSVQRNRPGLLSIRGTIAYMKGNLREGLDLLSQAEQAFRRMRNMPDLAVTLTRRATAYRFLGDYRASIEDAEEVIQLTEASDDLQRPRAEAMRLKGLALYRLGQARDAIDFLEHSSDLYTRLNDQSSIPVLLMETGMVYPAIGNYRQAAESYEKALQIWRQSGNLTWQANLLNNVGVLHHLQGEYEAAALAYEEGLICARRSHHTRAEALISIGIGDLYTEIEDYSVAEQSYQSASELVERMEDQFLSNSLILAQGNLDLLQKNADETRKTLSRVADSIRSGKSQYENGMLSLLYGRLHLLEGDAVQAIHELEQAEHHFEDVGDQEGAVSRYWLAMAYYQNNQKTESLQKLKSVIAGRKSAPHVILVAVHQARELPLDFPSDSEVRRIAGDLFTRASRFSARLPNVRRQLRRQAQVIHVPAPYLTIQSLGPVVVSIGGKPLSSSDWQTQSVRDLFFFFLNAHKPLTKEQIGAALWPDVYEPSHLKLRFKNEIYRLRRAVGQETILFDGVFYAFNRNMDYEYDVDAFESFLASARASNIIDEQIALYQKAVDLVHGPYLHDMDVDWAIPERERMNQVYLSALVSLADLLFRRSRPEKALAVCQRAIEYEPTHEAAYRLSMEIYHRLGNRGAVSRMYQACQEAMEKRLGMPPSDETIELHRTLSK